MDTRLHIIQQCTLNTKKVEDILGCIKKRVVSRLRVVILPSHVRWWALVRPHLEFSVQFLAPYYKRDMDTLEKIQQKATKVDKKVGSSFL